MFSAVGLWFAAVGLTGHAMLRHARLDFPTILTALPLSLIFGCLVQLFILNAASHLLPPPLSFYFATGLQLALALGSWRPASRPVALPPRGVALVFSAAAVLVFLVFFTISFRITGGDNLYEHWPLIATIHEGNFPVRLPFFPSSHSHYHYGHALLSAEIMHFSAAPIFWAPEFLKVAMAVSSVMLVFGTAFEARGNLLLACLAAFFWTLYGGGGTFLSGLAGMGVESLPSPGDLKALVVSIFTWSQVFPAMVLYLPTMAFGEAALLLIFHLIVHGEGDAPIRRGVVLLVALAALAIVSMPHFIICLGGIAVSSVIGYYRARSVWSQSELLRLGAFTAAALLLSAFQGGFLTDALFHANPVSESTRHWRWLPAAADAVTSELYIALSPQWFAYLATVFDIRLSAVLLAVSLIVRSRSKAFTLASAFLLAGFFAGHFLAYPKAEFNTHRFLTIGLHWSVLVWLYTDPAALERFTAPKSKVFLVSAAVLLAFAGSLPAAAILSANLLSLASTRSRSRLLGLDGVGRFADPEFQRMAKEIKASIPRGTRIASNEPMPLTWLTGRFSANAVPSHEMQDPNGLPPDYRSWTTKGLYACAADFICLISYEQLARAGPLQPSSVPTQLALLAGKEGSSAPDLSPAGLDKLPWYRDLKSEAALGPGQRREFAGLERRWLSKCWALDIRHRTH